MLCYYPSCRNLCKTSYLYDISRKKKQNTKIFENPKQASTFADHLCRDYNFVTNLDDLLSRDYSYVTNFC